MKRLHRRFIDTLRLHVKSGHGGMGLPRFGGIGGKGGDIYVEAKEDFTLKKTLNAEPRKRWSAADGGNSHKFRIIGEPAESLSIPVPVGTTVRLDGVKILGEVNSVGDKVLVTKGGTGGSPMNQYNGQKGQAHNIQLELKLLADVGLVGFPNAGKSTLLGSISRAKPKIASYPFTTLQPNIGMAEFHDGRQISIADLPGLIEGAWANVGMGHKFLRHVERTKLLLFVVDINGFQLGPQHPHRTPTENIILLNKELEIYSSNLLEKPALLVINKMDCPNAENKLEKLLKDLNQLRVCTNFPEEFHPEQLVTFDDIIPCSARENRASINHLKERLREVLDFYGDQEKDQVKVVTKARQQVQKLLSERSKHLV
ncbi:GTP-binding protein 10 homolog isoform X2 [Homarus americanus]|uniref:GTP-binding protein 10 homolog isoform X2 n=1 Tax=Homarus americanus TaxID=6706 RepID=UPI001C43B316|nr:GTP-binding protein 10 homolog isoform X2 [Homarus americanus]